MYHVGRAHYIYLGLISAIPKDSSESFASTEQLLLHNLLEKEPWTAAQLIQDDIALSACKLSMANLNAASMIAPTSVFLLTADTMISRYRVHWIADFR